MARISWILPALFLGLPGCSRQEAPPTRSDPPARPELDFRKIPRPLFGEDFTDESGTPDFAGRTSPGPAVPQEGRPTVPADPVQGSAIPRDAVLSDPLPLGTAAAKDGPSEPPAVSAVRPVVLKTDGAAGLAMDRSGGSFEAGPPPERGAAGRVPPGAAHPVPPAPAQAEAGLLGGGTPRPASASIQEPTRGAPQQGSSAMVPGIAAASHDPLGSLFEDCRRRFKELSSKTEGDEFTAIERADLESRLIALFFLRDRRSIEDYRDIIRSFKDEEPVNVEVELLLAALYQRVGQADLRDKALERVSQATTAPASASGLKLTGLAFARDIRGYRSYTPAAAAEFAAGDEVLVYGEIDGFKSTPVSRPSGGMGQRRSFSADLVLRGASGEELDRREILRAGSAVEIVEETTKPVHFWGRYPLPAHIAPGSYRLEIEARDLEGQKKAKGRLSLKVR